ncbi:hypothetical protein DFJ74DRAFT_693530 [Hyaloraphidium curvatum]|nr:hypothetical protein DFJ74DRAFT_693530 [Hyaloraphidium curvatum]
MPPGAIADGEPAGPPALEAIDPMLSDGEDGVQHDDEVATTEPEDDADMDEASGASGSDDDSASSTSTDPTPAPSPSQPAPVPLPPSLAFLPLPPRHSPPQAPQPHDQVLLTHVLACASAAYGPAHIALLGRDELLLERLLRLELGDDGDGGDWDGEEGGRRWLAARRAAYVRNRAEVRRIIFAYLYSPRPPIFRPRPPHPPSLAQPALSLLSSLLVHSPPLLSSLLRRAAMPPSQAAPQLIAHLLRLAPLPALRTALSNPEAERLGFGLSRGTVVALWDTEDAAPLRLLAEGMLLGGVPGPEALRGWAAERLREIWDTLTLPVLGGGAKSRALAREAARGNPMLAGMLRAGGADEARRREREGFEVRSRAFVRVLVGSWDEGEWPGVLFGVFAPRFEARPGWEGTVLDAFLLPEVDGWTPARARLAVDAVCALMRAHRAHAGAQDGLGFPAAQVERLLRFADAAYAYLFRCAEDGTSTPEEAERDAQTGGGTFMITPGAGVFCGLAREAADRMVGKTGVEFEDEVVRLQLLLDSAVDITVPEDSGTILDFWELDDAGRVLNHPPVPPSHPHSEILHLTARMVQDAAREILRRNQASHRSVRRATGAPQEPASPNLAQLFSPDRETFDEDEEEDVGLVWSGGAGGPGADDSAGKEITWEELADKGGGVRRIVVWTGAVAGVEGTSVARAARMC